MDDMAMELHLNLQKARTALRHHPILQQWMRKCWQILQLDQLELMNDEEYILFYSNLLHEMTLCWEEELNDSIMEKMWQQDANEYQQLDFERFCCSIFHYVELWVENVALEEYDQVFATIYQAIRGSKKETNIVKPTLQSFNNALEHEQELEELHIRLGKSIPFDAAKYLEYFSDQELTQEMLKLKRVQQREQERERVSPSHQSHPPVQPQQPSPQQLQPMEIRPRQSFTLASTRSKVTPPALKKLSLPTMSSKRFLPSVNMAHASPNKLSQLRVPTARPQAPASSRHEAKFQLDLNETLGSSLPVSSASSRINSSPVLVAINTTRLASPDLRDSTSLSSTARVTTPPPATVPKPSATSTTPKPAGAPHKLVERMFTCCHSNEMAGVLSSFPSTQPTPSMGSFSPIALTRAKLATVATRPSTSTPSSSSCRHGLNSSMAFVHTKASGTTSSSTSAIPGPSHRPKPGSASTNSMRSTSSGASSRLRLSFPDKTKWSRSSMGLPWDFHQRRPKSPNRHSEAIA